MLHRLSLFVIFVFSLFLASFTSALDIPLEGGGGGGTGKLSIGYVDMEKIFQLYPKTMDAKADYARQLKAKREELAKREAELNAVQTKLTVLESTLKTGAAPLGHSDVDSSTSTTNPTPSVEESAIDPNLENAEAKEPQSLVTLRKELQDKKADFEEQRKRAQDDLLAFERRQSQIILGNIYQALRDLAQEEQVTVVVDKSSILYGDATIDLTDKLQNKVRGY